MAVGCLFLMASALGCGSSTPCSQISSASLEAGPLTAALDPVRGRIALECKERGWCVLGQEEEAQCHGPHSGYSPEERSWPRVPQTAVEAGQGEALAAGQKAHNWVPKMYMYQLPEAGPR